jgi:glycosyltransferase involved in cell wall biosynthesis
MTVRVAHVLDSLSLGGTETQATTLVRGLAARGIENRLTHFRPGPLRDHLDLPHVTVDRLDSEGFLRPSFPRLVRRLARDFRAWGATVVQTYGFHTNLPGLLAGRLARVPVLVAGKRGFGTALTPAQRRVDRLARLLAHTTVVNAHFLRAQLEATETYTRRIDVIPNCVVDRGAAIVTPSPDPVVGMVANFRYPKDHATFLKAALLVAETVPAVEFHLIGAGPGEAEARALVAALELGPRVRFRGWRRGRWWRPRSAASP